MHRFTPWVALSLIVLGFLVSACGGSGKENSPTARSGSNQSEAGTSAEAQEMAAEVTECLSQERQSVAEGIAQQFAIEYDQVMSWFCSGHEYEDILLALQTNQVSEASVNDLLQMREQGISWDEIWETTDLVQPGE